MGRGYASHTLAGITSTRVNTVPKGIDNDFYRLRQVQVHALDTSDRSAPQQGRSLKLEKLPERLLHIAILSMGKLYRCG